MAARLYQDQNRQSALQKRQQELASEEKWRADQKEIEKRGKIQAEFDKVNQQKMKENSEIYEAARIKFKKEKLQKLIDSLDKN